MKVVQPMPSVHFLCSQCESRLAREATEPSRPCDSCQQATEVVAPPAATLIESCAACGHDQLYFQKDFNRRTGIALVVVGAVLAPFTYFISLAAVTILDYVIWRIVKNVIVCYQCQAVHRGYPQSPAIQPFDLVIHDRHVYGEAPPGAEEGHG